MEKAVDQISEEADFINRLRKADELKEELAHTVATDKKVRRHYKRAIAMLKNGDMEGYIECLEKIKDIKELALIQKMACRVTSLYAKGDRAAEALAEPEHARQVMLGNDATSSEQD